MGWFTKICRWCYDRVCDLVYIAWRTAMYGLFGKHGPEYVESRPEVPDYMWKRTI